MDLTRRDLLLGATLSAAKSPFTTGSEPVTSYKIVTTYNNYYEFGTDKEQPAQLAKVLRTSPWTVAIEGEVARPRTLDLDVILKLAPLEERVYRHRCVEGWSMVIPWIGFPLSVLLNQVERTSRAKFVMFESHYDSSIMWSPRRAGIPFPYREGLRLDEALHPLTLLAAGLHGQTLENQNGAPLRLVVPWKYGFKSIKSIVRIRFTETQPATTWVGNWPQAYGFYSNVNPRRDHPTHAQDRELRLGEGRFGQGSVKPTLMFNGYADQVAGLYSGMDLLKYY
jgi:methionine sulfoxide reductase catalytic subunit